MLRVNIFFEPSGIRFPAGRLGHWQSCCSGSPGKPSRSQSHSSPGSKMLVDVDLFDEGHCSSSRSVD
jgi:hypothetical protein